MLFLASVKSAHQPGSARYENTFPRFAPSLFLGRVEGPRAVELGNVIRYHALAPQGARGLRAWTRSGNLRLPKLFLSSLTPRERKSVGAAVSRVVATQPVALTRDAVGEGIRRLQLNPARLSKFSPSSIRQLDAVMDSLYELDRRVVKRDEFIASSDYGKHLDAIMDRNNPDYARHLEQMDAIQMKELTHSTFIEAQQARLGKHLKNLVSSTPDSKLHGQLNRALRPLLSASSHRGLQAHH